MNPITINTENYRLGKLSGQTITFTEWIIRLKYILVGAMIFKRQNGIYHVNIDQQSWRHFYNDGYSPLQAVNIDIEEGGE